MSPHDAILAGIARFSLRPVQPANENYFVAEIAIWRAERDVFVTTFDEWGGEIRSYPHSTEQAAKSTLPFLAKRFRPARITTGLFPSPFDGDVA